MANFDFSSEKLPGTEYGLIRSKDTKNNNAPQYRRYPINVQWDPEEPRLMALEIHLHQQKLDLSASLNADDKPYDLLLTSRGAGDGEAGAGTSHAAIRDSTGLNQEDLVNSSSQTSEQIHALFLLQAESLIVSMFCTADNQIFPKDVFLRDSSYRQLIAIKIPFFFFVTRVIR